MAPANVILLYRATALGPKVNTCMAPVKQHHSHFIPQHKHPGTAMLHTGPPCNTTATAPPGSFHSASRMHRATRIKPPAALPCPWCVLSQPACVLLPPRQAETPAGSQPAYACNCKPPPVCCAQVDCCADCSTSGPCTSRTTHPQQRTNRHTDTHTPLPPPASLCQQQSAQISRPVARHWV